VCVIGSLICNQNDKLYDCHIDDPIFTVQYGNLRTMRTDKWAISKSTKLSTKLYSDYQILYHLWQGWQQHSQSKYFQTTFPPSTGCSMWYSFCHTPEGRRKHQNNDTSRDCKNRIFQICYCKAEDCRITSHTSKPRAIP